MTPISRFVSNPLMILMQPMPLITSSPLRQVLPNSAMWSAEEKIHSKDSGFTLLEMIISLVIMGFIAASVGSGLVYSVQLYRNVQQMDTVMPQVDAAFNVIRKIGQDSSLSIDDITRRLPNPQESGSNQLLLDGKLLLDNVSFFKPSVVSAFENSSAKVRHFELRMFDDSKTIVFDVCPE